MGRSTDSIQSVDDNIIAVLGIFFAKSVNAVGIVRLGFGLMKQQVAEPSHAMAGERQRAMQRTQAGEIA